MPPARQETSAWRKENDTGNRRVSVASSEDAAILSANVPFEELLARELRKSGATVAKTTVSASGKTAKKAFLKRGARGWWMRQPGAKQKVVKHTLVSKGEEQETASRTAPVIQRKQQAQQQRRRRSLSASSSKTLSPVATPTEQIRTAPAPSRTLPPPVSPIRRTQYSNQADNDVDEELQRRQQNEESAMWKNASFRSTTSTDMGLRNVRQSFEAKQQREANEMAEFEAIERDLAAEKESYLKEKQQESSGKEDRPDQVHDNQDGHWSLPYSSFVSELHDQEQSRWQNAGAASIFDDSLDEGADSALVFDDHSALSKDDWMAGDDGFANHLRSHFGYGNDYGNPPSDLSAVSFDDSVPWDDGLSFQPRQSLGHEQFSNVGDSLTPKNNQSDDPVGTASRQQTTRRGVYFADLDDDSIDTLELNTPEWKAPVSSLVQQVFGGANQDDSNDTSMRSDGSEGDLINAEYGRSKKNLHVSPPPVPAAQDNSLSTLKQKLRGKQKALVARAPTGKRKGMGPPKAKSTVPSHISAKPKPGANTGKLTQPRDRAPPTGSSGIVLPAVIEEKLYELEEEVMFYKSETLQLQKRRDYCDQEVKKLAIERNEFARYQQEQRVVLEKEWERERAKMKKEEKLQERQWKLRMNATIAHQDRKDRSEVEMLKAQIVKMQLDEKDRLSKLKAANDNLRQRVAELEEKNRELCDEVKFLEKDRLEQWDKYERLFKERQEADSSGSKPEIISATREKNELRTVGDVFAIKGTADELLQRWNFSGEDGLTQDSDACTPTSEYLQANVADAYNPKRYSLDREDAHPSSEPGNLESANETGFASAAATFEWALPDAEDDKALHTTGYDNVTSVSTSSLSEHKTVSQEIDHPGGKKELLFTDGSKRIIFLDGNEKEIDANGHVVIRFTNGDHKEVFPDTGISVYYYHEAQTKLTTYPDNRKVYEFPNQQIETSLPDGTTEIQFADGIKKTIRPNGDEFSVFPDGTTMLEQPDGLREVTLLNQKKIRYFPDGQMACVAPSGQETRVRSDSEVKQLMAST